MTIPFQRKLFLFIVLLIVTGITVSIANMLIESLSTDVTSPGYNEGVGLMNMFLIIIGIGFSAGISFLGYSGFKTGDPVVYSKSFEKSISGIYVGKTDSISSIIKKDDGNCVSVYTQHLVYDFTKQK